jgi:ABC-type lipoprotein release transport system permease subunit
MCIEPQDQELGPLQSLPVELDAADLIFTCQTAVCVSFLANILIN